MALKTGPDYTNLPEKAMKLKLHLNAAKVSFGDQKASTVTEASQPGEWAQA